MPVINKKAPSTILTPEWRRLLSTVSDRYQRCALKRGMPRLLLKSG